LSPPLSLEQRWFEPYCAYTMAKFGMSLCVLGMSAEFQKYGIAVNALWPQTAIDTAAMAMIPGASQADKFRNVNIMGDAAYAILCQDSRSYTGNFTIDEQVVVAQGIKDLDVYANKPGTKEFFPDFFIPDAYRCRVPPKKVLKKPMARL
jgi:citronellol/citronellal dehydrogenase